MSSADETGFWTCRLMRKKQPDGSFAFGVYEVLYDTHGESVTWAEEPISVSGESVEDAIKKVKLIQGAFGRPVLDWNTGDKA